MSAQTKDRTGGSPAALENTLHAEDSTQLVELEGAADLDYLAFVNQVSHAASGRFSAALYARWVNLLKDGSCTCVGDSICPVCRAWMASQRLNTERRAAFNERR